MCGWRPAEEREDCGGTGGGESAWFEGERVGVEGQKLRRTHVGGGERVICKLRGCVRGVEGVRSVGAVFVGVEACVVAEGRVEGRADCADLPWGGPVPGRARGAER